MFVLVSFGNTEVEGRGTSKRAHIVCFEKPGCLFYTHAKTLVGLVFPGISGYVVYFRVCRVYRV